jgi:hypothetical protein
MLSRDKMLRVLKPLQEFCTLRLDRDSGASGCYALLIPVRCTMTGLSVCLPVCPFEHFHSLPVLPRYVPYSVELRELDN